MKILVVDDSEAILKSTARFLRAIGHETLECHDGREAWALLESRAGEIHGVVSDYEMPHMSGLELLCRMRYKSETLGIPFVLFSGTLLGHLELAFLKKGGGSFVPKPSDPSDLLTALGFSV